jgi:hypothetical protein
MSDQTLQQVESHRRELVVRAQAELARVLREQAALVARHRALALEGRRRDATLTAARTSFAAAQTVRELHGAAAWAAASRAAVHDNHASLRRFELELARVGARVRDCQQALRAAEVGRSTAARLLDRRAREVSRRTALRAEDEADDAFRARFRG